MYFSDEIRMEYLGREIVEDMRNENDTVVSDLEELSYNENSIYVINTPDYRMFVEYWADACWEAFEKKYDIANAENFEKYMIPRMKDIGEKLNLNLMNWDYIPDDEFINEWEGYGIGSDYPTGYAVFYYKKGYLPDRLLN